MAYEMTDIGGDIYLAIQSGDETAVKNALLKHPEELHYRNPYNVFTWLHFAAEHGRAHTVRLLLDLGIEPNIVNPRPDGASASYFTKTALESAIENGHVNVARILLSRGANPNLDRPLIAAINHQDPTTSLEFVKILVEHGADVNRHFPWFGSKDIGFTPLQWAEANGKTEIADYLRSKGAIPPPPKPRQPPANREAEIVAHLKQQFGPARPGALREIVPTGLPIAIHVIPPTKTHNQLTLFTTGMSEQAMRVPERCDDYRYAELVFHLPADWPLTKKALADPKYNWPVRWLQETARFPHDNDTWLGGPFTIISKNPQEKLASNVEFTAMMLAAKGEMHAQDGRLIQLYTLIPLYPEERRLEMEHGLPALMRALDKFGISDVVSLNRPNVAIVK